MRIPVGCHDFPIMVAQQVQFETYVPPHGAPAFLRYPLEDFHGVLPLDVDDRDAGAVDETDAGALAETYELEEHRKRDEALGHDLHEAVIRECPCEEVLPMPAHASDLEMLEVAVRIEVETNQYGDDLGI